MENNFTIQQLLEYTKYMIDAKEETENEILNKLFISYFTRLGIGYYKLDNKYIIYLYKKVGRKLLTKLIYTKNNECYQLTERDLSKDIVEHQRQITFLNAINYKETELFNYKTTLEEILTVIQKIDKDLIEQIPDKNISLDYFLLHFDSIYSEILSKNNINNNKISSNIISPSLNNKLEEYLHQKETKTRKL